MIARRIFLFMSFFQIVVVTLLSQTGSRVAEDIIAPQSKGRKSIQEVSNIEGQEFILDKPIVPENYIVGPGDEFYVSIFTDELVEFVARVNPVGDLVLPGIGKIPVAGQRLCEAVTLISDFIRRNGVKTGLVSVSLSNIRRFKIQILGAILNPGFYIATPATRLSELIREAGGFLQLAKLHQIYIYRDSVLADTVDFVNFLLHGDLRDNPYLSDGEMVYIPFGNVVTEGVQLRGSVADSGYCIIKPGETLWDLLKRKGALKKDARLDHVVVIRNENGVKRVYKVKNSEFDDWILRAGDEIDVMKIKGVSVIGYVNKPGSYDYILGLKAWDYIGLAGGITEKGSLKKIVVIHENGEKEKGQDVTIMRGDVIIVGRSNRDIFIGERSSILEVVASLMSVFLAYLAASRYTK